MAITREQYEKGERDRDLDGLESLESITKFTDTEAAVTKICLNCERLGEITVNACTSNNCMKCGKPLGKKPGKSWRAGPADAYTV